MLFNVTSVLSFSLKIFRDIRYVFYKKKYCHLEFFYNIDDSVVSLVILCLDYIMKVTCFYNIIDYIAYKNIAYIYFIF